MKIALLLLLILMSLTTQYGPDCFEGEHCYWLWPPIENFPYCDGGTYTIQFCYNPDDPGNRDYHHHHSYCTSSIELNNIFLPLVMK